MQFTRFELKFSGLMLLASSVLVILVMGHHPQAASVNFETATMRTHVAMQILLSLNFFGFAVFSLCRSSQRMLAVMALIAAMVGLVGNIIATTIDGYVFAAILEVEDPAMRSAMLAPFVAFLEGTARMAVFAQCLAIILWSVGLLMSRSKFGLIAGVIGMVVAGIVGSTFLLAPALSEGVAFITYASMSLWGILIGIALIISRRLPDIIQSS